MMTTLYRVALIAVTPLLCVALVLVGDTTVAQNTVRLLNTEYNAEGTGNVLTVPFIETWPAAVCQDSLSWGSDWHYNAPGVDAPTGSCDDGAAAAVAVGASMGYDDSATEYMDRAWRIPNDWTGSLDLKLVWYSPATSGDVVWQISTKCVADNESLDPDGWTFNAAQTITDTAKASGGLMNDASLSSVTTTGCAAGELLYLKVLRNPAHASDTLGNVARLVYVELTYRRAI